MPPIAVRMAALLLLLLSTSTSTISHAAPTDAQDAAAAAAAQSSAAPFGGYVGLHCTTRSGCGFLPGLACLNGKCDYCRHDADCSSTGKIRRCHRVETVDPETDHTVALMAHSADGEYVEAAYCVEKDLFAPFLSSDAIATALAFLSTALGSGCGVGGGGLLVPAYILVTGLSPKRAIPLSKATIFGNAVAIYLFNLHRKHPLKPHVPVINYDVASIMEPTTLIGAVIGVMLNHVFPNWLILVLLVTLLAFITHHTFLKGHQIREKETRLRMLLVQSALTGRKGGGGRGRAWSIYRHFDWKVAARRWLAKTRHNRKLKAKLLNDQDDFESLPPLVTNAPPRQVTPLLRKKSSSTNAKEFTTFGTFSSGATTINSDDTPQSELRQLINRREADIFPLRVVLPLLASWAVVLLQAILRGGHGSGSIIGVTCNTLEYWVLTLVPLLILVVITWRVGYRLRLDNRLRVVSGYTFLEGDMHWTWRKVTKFPLYCTTAGVAAGLLGIGGGMVKSPIMLEMGILPAVQSATASYMILYTSSSTTLQFAIAGQFPGSLQYDYAAWFAFIGFLGGLCGQYIVAYLVKKYKRESIVVYTLAATIGLSAVAMGLVGVSNTIHDYNKGASMGFASLCGNS